MNDASQTYARTDDRYHGEKADNPYAQAQEESHVAL